MKRAALITLLTFTFADIGIVRAESPDAAASVDQPSDSNAAGTSSSEQRYTLRYQFQVGQFVHYRMQSSSRMELSAREVTQTISESRDTDKHYRVVTVDEAGNALLEPVIDRIRARAQSDEEEPIDYDSASTGNDARAFTRFKDTVGRPVVRVRFSTTGEVVDVLPIDADQATGSSEEDAQKHGFLIPLPHEPIEIGHTWDHDFKVKVSADAKLKSTLSKMVTIRQRYTLEKVADGIAEISFKTYPLSLERDPSIQVQLVQRTLLGTVRMDLERGLILETTSRGSGSVFNAFGPLSAMKARSQSHEEYVANPTRVPRPSQPAGPALPAGQQVSDSAGD